MDESAPAPHMRPELAVLVDWLRISGRMAEVDYPRLLHDVFALTRRAALLTDGQVDVDTLARACDAVQTHLAAAVREHDFRRGISITRGVRAVGFEPTASGLKVRCSTTELRPRSRLSSQSVHRVRPSREGRTRCCILHETAPTRYYVKVMRWSPHAGEEVVRQ